MSYENLGPGPDLSNIDLDKMDFGTDPSDAEPNEPDDTTPEKLEEEFAEANPDLDADKGKGAEEVVEPDQKAEEQPRDEKGRFSEKEPRIPKSRFDEQVGKEREAREAAERRAAELERRLNQSQSQKEAQAQIEQIETKVEELETKYQELLLDGNTKDAATVMKQIRLAERQIATAEAEARASMATARALEADRLDASIARLEADHPEFNPDSESYDADLVSLVLSKQRDLIASGMTPSVALEKAGRSVADRFLKKEAEPEEKKGLGTVKNDDRTKEAVAKALATQKAQPASMKDVGYDSDKSGATGLPDVSKLTADEFAALPKATQDRLLGNVV